MGGGTGLGDFARMWAICESRNTTRIGTRGSTLLVAKELANSKLCQQEDSEALEGPLEARLERGQYQDKIEPLEHIRWTPPVCEASVQAYCGKIPEKLR